MEAMKKLIAALHLDGVVNTLTGLGTTRDKTTYATIAPKILLSTQELENLYQEDIPAKIVDCVVDDGTREGFDLILEDDTDGQLESKFFARRKELGLLEKEKEAWKQGRLSGWGALYLIVDDGGLPEEPLNPEKASKILGCVVWERADVNAIHSYYEDPTNPLHGQPEIYSIQPRNPQGQNGNATSGAPRLIHASRMIVFHGPYTPKLTKIQNMGFCVSVLQRPYQTILDFLSSWGAINNILTDSAQSIYSMKGLQQSLAAGRSADIQTRLSLLDMQRSIMRAIVIDADGEKFERQQTSLTGYPDVLETFMSRMAAAADMPVTKLFGISPAGMNATGESDLTIWENTVKSAQTTAYLPALEKTGKIILRELGLSDESYQIVFKPLRQMSNTEQSALRKTQAEIDVMYIDKGVYTEAEVAVNRFGPRGWSMETTLDLKVRNQIIEEDNKKAFEESQNPDPGPIPPVTDAENTDQ